MYSLGLAEKNPFLQRKLKFEGIVMGRPTVLPYIFEQAGSSRFNRYAVVCAIYDGKKDTLVSLERGDTLESLQQIFDEVGGHEVTWYTAPAAPIDQAALQVA